MAEYVAVDIETTGLNKKTDKIIEIAAILYDLDPKTGTAVVQDEWTSVVEPGAAISQEIFKLTGLVNEDFVDAPFIEAVADEFMAFINPAEVLVTYNGNSFDLAFLAREIGAPWAAYMEGGDHIDMLEVIRRPDVGKDWLGQGAHKLTNAHKRLCPNASVNAHRALGDCRMLMALHSAVYTTTPGVFLAAPDPFLTSEEVLGLLDELRKHRGSVERFNRANRLLEAYFALQPPGVVHVAGFQVTIKENKPRRRLIKEKKKLIPDDYYELGEGSMTAKVKEEL